VSKAFVAGVHAGGKVIRKKLPGRKYINLVRVNGRWIPGEVKKRKKDAE
jgi:hypothetical protein